MADPRSPACRGQHRLYLMTCGEFVELRDRSGDRCEMPGCGVRGEDTRSGKLFIDHDGLHGYWAVRGLLCNSCNSNLGHARRRGLSAEQSAYVDRAWFHRFDLSLEAEPVGALEVAGRWDTRWRREGDGFWFNHRTHHYKTWREIWRARGPHLAITGYTREYVRRLAEAEREARQH